MSFDCHMKGSEEGKMSNQDNANCTSAKEIALVGSKSQEGLQDRNLWVGDTGATCHMVCDDSKLFDFESINDEVVVGDGRPLRVEKIGKLKVHFANSSGELSEFIMDKVKFVPSLRMNLFSLVVGIKKGWKLESDGDKLILSKQDHQILFNKRISMDESFLLCAEESLKDHLNVLSERKQMHLINFHRKLGHTSEEVTKQTAKRLGIKLVGPLKSCKDCILGKIW
jgi:hypothetical protein